jgi:2-amino-4-hydroxy-6-hydroxymethyldihydropteridine diphosphokinase
MTEVLIGLGSNIEPWSNLREAWQRLESALGSMHASPVYRSPPLGYEGPDFLNLVARFDSDASPAAIEAVLSAIERAGGRSKCERTGSRTVDLDLLLCGPCVDPGQRLPRDDVLRYPFVLAPAVDLAPDLRHPVTGVRLADAWRAMAPTVTNLERVGVLDEPPPTSRCSDRRRPR